MRRIGVALLVILTVGACAQANLTVEDAYKIGCPAVDAAAGGGTVVGKASVAGLKKLRDSRQLDPEPQKWLESAIAVLDSDDPNGASDETKKLIQKGCTDHGYPLRNLK